MDDLISRQAALYEVEEWLDCYYGDDYEDIRAGIKQVMRSLKKLPSVQPEPEHTMEEFMYGQELGDPEDGSL